MNAADRSYAGRDCHAIGSIFEFENLDDHLQVVQHGIPGREQPRIRREDVLPTALRNRGAVLALRAAEEEAGGTVSPSIPSCDQPKTHFFASYPSERTCVRGAKVRDEISANFRESTHGVAKDAGGADHSWVDPADLCRDAVRADVLRTTFA